jgi:hypothetical protein
VTTAAVSCLGEEGSRCGGSHLRGALSNSSANWHREEGSDGGWAGHGLKRWVGQSSRWAGAMKNQENGKWATWLTGRNRQRNWVAA